MRGSCASDAFFHSDLLYGCIVFDVMPRPERLHRDGVYVMLKTRSGGNVFGQFVDLRAAIDTAADRF